MDEIENDLTIFYHLGGNFEDRETQNQDLYPSSLACVCVCMCVCVR
jgi:hypothetical protein